MSSSSRGGEWQLKWKEAGHWSQQMRSPPSPQASQTSWLWPLPSNMHLYHFRFPYRRMCILFGYHGFKNNSTIFKDKPTWPLVVGVQHEGVPGLLQVHVGLMPLRVTPRRSEQSTHLGHDRAAVPARILCMNPGSLRSHLIPNLRPF